MFESLLITLLILVIINIAIGLLRRPTVDLTPQLKNIITVIERTEKLIKDEFGRNREEGNKMAKQSRDELNQSLNQFSEQFSKNVKTLNELLREKFGDFSAQQTKINQQNIEHIKEIKQTIEKQLKDIRDDNTKQLNQMRITVDEKLQKTLNDRLSQSFETVSKQLQSVQVGLGEMKNLASDVGGLKKVLSNVKMRGSIGELQLEMLLESILAPDQYQANVNTKQGSQGVVEFAIKLPGKGDKAAAPCWLPIDSKFPKDIYERLVDAHQIGDTDEIAAARKNMENTLKKMAKDICDKYIDPPNTTDFGIMFLPFEGIYAEVVRNVTLLETLQRDYKIIVTGPTTLAALLNSLQMGFKTLGIEKQSAQILQVLGGVKKEFENFETLMGKAHKNIKIGLGQIDDLMSTRTRAMTRQLKEVEVLSSQLPDSSLISDKP